MSDEESITDEAIRCHSFSFSRYDTLESDYNGFYEPLSVLEYNSMIMLLVDYLTKMARITITYCGRRRSGHVLFR